MLNFAIDPRILAPHVPGGNELDFYEGETFVSVVGFLFYQTIVFGMPIPRHRNFEEVNLRFYVRKKSADTWRRGVVFIRELVPKIAIAVTARVFYGEPYQALPMRSSVTEDGNGVSASYEWRRGRNWERLALRGHGMAQSIPAGSPEEFITEHYWGYTKRAGLTTEYNVDHLRWKIWPADQFEFTADVETLYGKQFVETLAAKPHSAFIADGSFVSVFARSNSE